MSKEDSISLNCKVDDNLYQTKKCKYITVVLIFLQSIVHTL